MLAAINGYRDMKPMTYITSRSHRHLHGQDSAGNDKVEEPLRSGTDGDVQGT
jgi:hypothetical protein